MYATSIGLPDNVRQSSIALLNGRLADTLTVAAQLKHAHWNVRGPRFGALHVLFDQLHRHVTGFADELAERAATLGGAVDGLLPQVAASAVVPAYPDAANHEQHHLEALAHSVATLAENLSDAARELSEMGDTGSVDVLTRSVTVTQKSLWMIEAHLTR